MTSLRERLARLPVTTLIALVRAYRFFLSPWLGSSCRFEPTCSSYSLQSLQAHGAAAGTYLTLRRLVRCHPWCDGGHDPVPARPFTRFSTIAGGVAHPIQPLDKTSP
jgi:uncharacterized protein